MKLPDYSTVLTDQQLLHEEALWAECRYYETYGAAVRETGEARGVSSVLELGCGTGWVPTVLPVDWRYVGADASLPALSLALRKHCQCSSRSWVLGDVRQLEFAPADLVCSFAMLKHFGLDEWESVCARVLSWGRYAVLSLNLAEVDTDDGVDFHHTWASEATWARVLQEAGKQECTRQTLWPVRGGPPGGREIMVTLEPRES